jgi:hypothetical protein
MSASPDPDRVGVSATAPMIRAPRCRKQLDRLAADADMTMRAFVLHALKEKGLDVRDEDLVDLRKQRGERCS